MILEKFLKVLPMINRFKMLEKENIKFKRELLYISQANNYNLLCAYNIYQELTKGSQSKKKEVEKL